MIGIYKITNQVNGKCYIGQSVNIYKRWSNHRSACQNPNAHEYDYYLYRAMRKYGIENFIFEVLEECEASELNEREIYWIEQYDSYRNGYNETEGGDYARHSMKITPNMLDEIDELLKNNINIQQIADRFKVSYEMIQGINTGRYWHRDNIEYPIGKYIVGLHNGGVKKYGLDTIGVQKKVNYCIDCGKEINKNATRCLECFRKYSRKVERPDIETLLQLLSTNSFVKVGKKYNVTDNAIRKWCDSYGIPKKRKEILEYIKENNITFNNK